MMDLQVVAGLKFLEKAQAENISPDSKEFKQLRKQFIDGYCQGFEYFKGLLHENEELIPSRAWTYASDYLVKNDSKKHLSKYFEEALTEQVTLDKRLAEKRFEIWLDKAINRCYSLFEVLKNKAEGDIVVIDREAFFKEIKGFEL